MNHAPDVPFLCAYLKAITVHHNDNMVEGWQQKMVWQGENKFLRQLRCKLPCLSNKPV